MHPLWASQSSGTARPFGNCVMGTGRLNTSNWIFHPRAHIYSSLPFLSCGVLFPFSCSPSPWAPRELLHQIHRNCTADRRFNLSQFIATESQERKAHPKNKIWSRSALGGESWGAW
jgi:hypothetical protein